MTELQKFDIDADLLPSAQAAAASGADAVLFVDISGDRAREFVTAMATQSSLGDKPLYLTDGAKATTLIVPLPTGIEADIIFERTVGTVPAAPAGSEFDLFQASYLSEFRVDPASFAFTANGYDALYVGAAAVVYASRNYPGYDGRHIAEGLSHLVSGPSVELGKLTWPDVRSGLTSGENNVDISGISGPLDFEVDSGQADAAIEIWKPSNIDFDGLPLSLGECPGAAPCFAQLEVIDP
jgi:hypothetical protein